MRFRDGEGVFKDWFYRSPDVDDLVAGLEEGVGIFGKVVRDAAFGGRVGLVDVYTGDGATE